MSNFATDISAPTAQQVSFTDDALEVHLTDGRTITAPLAWYPSLTPATSTERKNWRMIGRGEGIHWPELDEDISVAGVLAGKHSGESQNSLKRWLQNRSKD